MIVLRLLASLLLAALLLRLGLAGYAARKQWPAPLGGSSKFGAIPTERVPVVERQDALRRQT